MSAHSTQSSTATCARTQTVSIPRSEPSQIPKQLTLLSCRFPRRTRTPPPLGPRTRPTPQSLDLPATHHPHRMVARQTTHLMQTMQTAETIQRLLQRCRTPSKSAFQPSETGKKGKGRGAGESCWQSGRRLAADRLVEG